MQDLQPHFGNLRLHLGEGLHWDPVAGCLWFVDILGLAIYRWRPGTDAPQARAAPHGEWPLRVEDLDG